MMHDYMFHERCLKLMMLWTNVYDQQDAVSRLMNYSEIVVVLCGYVVDVVLNYDEYWYNKENRI